MELMARVEALLHRSRPSGIQPGSAYRFGAIVIHTESQQVIKNGVAVTLTPTEYGLLLALVQRDGAVISRTVDTHVAELRRKLEPDPARPRYIITVRKSGYRLDTLVKTQVLSCG